MNRFTFSLLFLLLIGAFSNPCHAQQYTRGNINMGFGVSLIHTQLTKDSITYKGTFLPGLGVGFYSSVTPWMDVIYGAQATMKGTNNFDTLGNIRNFYGEAYAGIQLTPIKSLKLLAGVQPSFLIKSRTVRFSGDTQFGKKWYDISGFGSPIEFFAGVQLKAGPASSLTFRYYIPHKNTEFSRMELKLLFIMVEGFKRVTSDQ